MSIPEMNPAATLGLLLGVSLLAGALAEAVKFPKVTAYLLVGVLMGPAVLHWVPTEHVHSLEPFTRLAMALVLFNLGCHFPLDRMRRIFKPVAALSLGEMGMTFCLVTFGMMLCGQSGPISLLFGTLAIATAPATTILVLKEIESEGPVTEYANSLVAVNNLVSIIAFEVAFLFVYMLRGSLETSVLSQLGTLCRDIGGSLLLGVAAGLFVSYGCGLAKPSRWIVLLVAAITFVLGVCEAGGLPYMLAFLAMGVVVVNTSDLSSKIIAELDRMTGLLSVMFFVLHGAELDIHAFLTTGWIGAAYIIFRCSGKYFGIYSAAKFCNESEPVRKWLGATLLAQAGAAIALSGIAAKRDPDLGKPLQAIILGTVVFFEIVGPFLIRRGVLRAGEVPLGQAIRHSSTSVMGQFREVLARMMAALGREAVKRRPADELTVQNLLRANVRGINWRAQLNEVIAHIEHSHDNTYPVINDNATVVGVIRYPALSHAMYDPYVSSLVCAEDLAAPYVTILYPDEPAEQARELFIKTSDDCIPVVSREPPHTLLGVVRRADVMKLLISDHRRSQGEETGGSH